MNKHNPIISAIIVIYNPHEPTLLRLLQSLENQVQTIIIVDNSPQITSALKTWDQIHSANFKYIPLEKNMGIGYAQNTGIEWAITQKADYVLLMDQDSIPSMDMVANLLGVFSKNHECAPNIIAAGPIYIDPRSLAKSSFLTSRFGFPTRQIADTQLQASEIISVHFLISSGSLICLSKLLQVGGMRSGYFIDHVDTEWCLRAKNKGFSLVGQSLAQMEHSLGDETKRLWFFGWRIISHHTPIRDYYMFRNTILTVKNTSLSLPWLLFLHFRLVQFSTYFLLLAPHKKIRAKMMLLGIWHGLKNVDGELLVEKDCHLLPIPLTPLDPKSEGITPIRINNR